MSASDGSWTGDANAPLKSMDGAQSAFALTLPQSKRGPIVCASPHSGRHYPAAFMRSARLDGQAIRRSEDALVDVLVEASPLYGAPLISAIFARAYLDVNREPYELDQDMFLDKLPAYASLRTARVAAGLGSIARVVSEGLEIYREKLVFAEARSRIEAIHRPYHTALQALLDDARALHGYTILLDWHSMPSVAYGSAPGPEVVLGDRFGTSCDPYLTQVVDRHFVREGYRVARNAPYAGGFTTEFYGRPKSGVHALQIELSRGLYLNEKSFQPTDGFNALIETIGRLLKALVDSDWSCLAPTRPSGAP